MVTALDKSDKAAVIALRDMPHKAYKNAGQIRRAMCLI
jgi:hypothetical protein